MMRRIGTFCAVLALAVTACFNQPLDMGKKAAQQYTEDGQLLINI